MKKILVVDDDQFFREAVVSALKSHGYEVIEATNGKVARDIFAVQPFDLVLSDVQMPFLDGLDLLQWVRSKGTTPFVLMTGFGHIVETQKAFELGATDFIAKPFQNFELANVVKKILTPEQKNVVTDPSVSLKFCRVSLQEFVARRIIDFDVFIQLSDSKFIKIGYAGSELPIERIRSYQEKGVQYLYISREDFSKLVDFNLELSKTVAGSSGIAHEKKVNFMRYTGEVILEKAFVIGVDKETYDEAKEMLSTTINVITQGSENLELLMMLNSHSDWVYAHSIASGMFALMIARVMGITSSQTFFKLGMAGLFHEIGYKEIPKEILEKPRPLLTQVERALVETHVMRSREILIAIKGVPQDVIEIVYQHHEDVVGQGYPNRVDKLKIHPLAKIFQVADLFSDIAVKTPHHPGMAGAAALQSLHRLSADRLDKEALGALHKIFKFAKPAS